MSENEEKMKLPHVHKWKVDYRFPTLDSNPPHHALRCECGAVACGTSQGEEIHKLRERPNEESVV